MKIEAYLSGYVSATFPVLLTMKMRKCWAANFSTGSASRPLRIILGVSIGLLGGSLAGCTTTLGPAPASVSPVVGSPTVTGNWQFNLTPSSGVPLFPYLSGYLYQDSEGTFLSAELTETSSSGCFLGVNPISGIGPILGTSVTVDSFSVNGQFLDLVGTMNNTGNSITGNYSVVGGCAAGDAGTFTGTRYSQLTGTYSGTIDKASSTEMISLKLQQNASGNGKGVFLVTGTAIFSGVSNCFTSGTIVAPSGYITGSMTQLIFTDMDGNEIQLTGTIDAAADRLTLSSITMTSGSCAGTSYGTATLKT
jgi:hypothetical protein